MCSHVPLTAGSENLARVPPWCRFLLLVPQWRTLVPDGEGRLWCVTRRLQLRNTVIAARRMHQRKAVPSATNLAQFLTLNFERTDSACLLFTPYMTNHLSFTKRSVVARHASRHGDGGCEQSLGRVIGQSNAPWMNKSSPDDAWPKL